MLVKLLNMFLSLN